MPQKGQELSVKISLDVTGAKETIKELIDMLEHANQLKNELNNR
jgi:hypothetical protein